MLSYMPCARLCLIDLCSEQRERSVDTGVGSIGKRCADEVYEGCACCTMSIQYGLAPSAGAARAPPIHPHTSGVHCEELCQRSGVDDVGPCGSSKRASKFNHPYRETVWAKRLPTPKPLVSMAVARPAFSATEAVRPLP